MIKWVDYEEQCTDLKPFSRFEVSDNWKDFLVGEGLLLE